MDGAPDPRATADLSLEAARDALATGRLREVFHAALAAVALVRGPDRTVVYANPAFGTLCGGDVEERPVGGLGPPGLAALVEEVLVSGRPVRAEEQRTAAPEERLATLTASPVPGIDATTDVLVVGLDVTGQALDRRDVQRHADENRWVENATAAMQVAVEPDDELVALAEALVPTFADACSAILLDTPTRPGRDGVVLRGRRVAFVSGDGERGGPVHAGALVWGPGSGVLHEAVRADRPVVQTRADAGERADRGWADDTGGSLEWVRGGRVTSVAATPVRDGEAIVGLLAFATVDRPPFDRADLAVMERVAVRAGTAVSQGLRFTRQRAASLTLQRSMLTRAPTVPGLEVVSRYRPSVADAEVGGDWYDAFARPDGDLVVAIGDVAGHDLAAAATMGQLRSMLRALAVDRDAPPAELLTRLDRVATGLDVTEFTTLVLARLRTAPGGRGPVTVEWSAAGHPPPLLLPAHGAPVLLEEGGGMVLGVRPESPRTTATTTLAADDTLVLYTDGLVERRGRNPDAHVTTLVTQAVGAAAERGPGGGAVPLAALCDELVARAPVDDDVAVLAVRSHPSGAT